PTPDDRVQLRVADPGCVTLSDDGTPVIDPHVLPVYELPYAALFSKDGRIRTRLTPRRLDVIRKLEANPTIESAARRSGRRARAMIGTGIAFRGKRPVATD